MMDAGNMLKPMLSRNKLRCIGETMLDKYRKCVEKDPAFERRFQQVLVKEPSEEETLYILRGIRERYETHCGLQNMDTALVAAASLSKRYISGRFLPDKAIDLVDEACTAMYTQLNSQPDEINTLERRKTRLEVEQAALQREVKEGGTGEKTTARLGEIGKVLGEKLRGRQALSAAERGGSAETAASAVKADMQYHSIPEAEKPAELEARAADAQVVKMRITPELIEEVVSRGRGLRSRGPRRTGGASPAPFGRAVQAGCLAGRCGADGRGGRHAEPVWAGERPAVDGELPLHWTRGDRCPSR